MDLSLLTDGLRAEREQGITIDVAYRYFATPKRKFIIADTPGHIQYTRNMVTGASTANLAIILVDARKASRSRPTGTPSSSLRCWASPRGVLREQDGPGGLRRGRVRADQERLEDFSSKLDVQDVRFIPIGALKGDMVVGGARTWAGTRAHPDVHAGEHPHRGRHQPHRPALPVQYVVRPQDDRFHDYRGYAGRMLAGVFGWATRCRCCPAASAAGSKASTRWRSDRGGLRAHERDDDPGGRDRHQPGRHAREPEQPAETTQDVEVMLCWFNERPLVPNGKYALKHTSRDARCMVKEVKYKMDINTLHKVEGDKTIGMNDIGRVSLRTTVPLNLDPYGGNRSTGSLILVDEGTNETMAAGMVV